jgi:hypothetical protein
LEIMGEHRDAPESTGSGGVPQEITLDGAKSLADEAAAILQEARDGRSVSGEQARAFARACIEADEIGRVALAVIDGGVFAGTRLVALAERVLREQLVQRDTACSVVSSE